MIANSQTSDMGQCGRTQSSVAVASFQHRNEFSLGMLFGESNGIPTKGMIERRWYVLPMPLHAGILVRASVETCRDEDEGVLRQGSSRGEETEGFGEEDLVFFVVQTFKIGFRSIVIQVDYEAKDQEQQGARKDEGC